MDLSVFSMNIEILVAFCRCARSTTGFSIRNTANDSRFDIFDISSDGPSNWCQIILLVCTVAFLKHLFQAEHSRREEYNKRIADENEKQEGAETKELEKTDAKARDEEAGTEKTLASGPGIEEN